MMQSGREITLWGAIEKINFVSEPQITLQIWGTNNIFFYCIFNSWGFKTFLFIISRGVTKYKIFLATDWTVVFLKILITLAFINYSSKMYLKGSYRSFYKFKKLKNIFKTSKYKKWLKQKSCAWIYLCKCSKFSLFFFLNIVFIPQKRQITDNFYVILKYANFCFFFGVKMFFLNKENFDFYKWLANLQNGW